MEMDTLWIVCEYGSVKMYSVRIQSALFTDNTTIVSMSEKIEVNVVKGLMSKWEETNNDTKEMQFVTNMSDTVLVLGSCMGLEEHQESQ